MKEEAQDCHWGSREGGFLCMTASGPPVYTSFCYPALPNTSEGEGVATARPSRVCSLFPCDLPMDFSGTVCEDSQRNSQLTHGVPGVEKESSLVQVSWSLLTSVSTESPPQSLLGFGSGEDRTCQGSLWPRGCLWDQFSSKASA